MIVFRLLLILAGLYIAIAGTLFLLQRRMMGEFQSQVPRS